MTHLEKITEENFVEAFNLKLAPEQERFVFRAAHARQDATIYWHIDDRFIGETKGEHQIACRAGKGRHLLTLVDDYGGQRKIWFEVK